MALDSDGLLDHLLFKIALSAEHGKHMRISICLMLGHPSDHRFRQRAL